MVRALNFVCRCRWHLADICHPTSLTNNKPERGNLPCRSISKSRPRPRRSVKKSANGCTTNVSRRKRNSTPSRSRKCWANCARRRAQGLWCPFVPKEYGGMGLGPLANALVQMELGESMLGALSMNTQGPDDASMMTILTHGTEYQKEKFLKPLLNGDKRICFSMTEKAAGADATGMQTTAVKDG